MIVGIFADTHDHLDNLRRVVTRFNERGCECVLFAGDLVSTFAVPPLRQLQCPLYGCFGDNEGNKTGLRGGFRILGEIQEAPAEYVLADGACVVVAHMERQLAGYRGPATTVICGHTHKPLVKTLADGRLFINPGETSGWTFGRPTVAIWETTTGQVEIVEIDMSVPLPAWDTERRERSRQTSRHGLPPSGVTHVDASSETL